MTQLYNQLFNVSDKINRSSLRSSLPDSEFIYYCATESDHVGEAECNDVLCESVEVSKMQDQFEHVSDLL